MDRLLLAMMCATCVLSAQTANPLSTELVRSYDRIKGFLVTMAEKMAAEDYGGDSDEGNNVFRSEIDKDRSSCSRASSY